MLNLRIAIIPLLLSDVYIPHWSVSCEFRNISCIFIDLPPIIQEKETKGYLALIALLHPEWGDTLVCWKFVKCLQIFIPSLDQFGHRFWFRMVFKSRRRKVSILHYETLSEFSESPPNRIGQKHVPVMRPSELDPRKFFRKRSHDLTFNNPASFMKILVSEGLREKRRVCNDQPGIQKVIESMKKYRLVIEKLEILW